MANSPKSYLFCTTTIMRHVESALKCSADAIILDLETTIPESEKEHARVIVQNILQDKHDPLVYVRINEVDTNDAYRDLLEIVCGSLAGIMLPRMTTAREIQVVSWLLSRLESERGIAAGTIEILPLIESAAGVENLRDIMSASERVQRGTFGAADYTLDMGSGWSEDESELAYIRTRLLHVSRALGKQPPIDGVWLDLKNDAAFTLSNETSRRMGFAGRQCIHPKQADFVNAAYSPTEDEVREAKRIVDAFNRASADGNVALRLDGRLIDRPIAERAENLIQQHRSVSGV